MSDRESLGGSFRRIGATYERYRPGFPAESAQWLLPTPVQTGVDLAAGTGKFTELLVERVDDLVAIEPSEAMLEQLRRKLPSVRALLASAESIPLPDASVQIVTVAQAFHWFDRDRATAEIARILAPGGVLGLVWNGPDPACSWDQAAYRVAHPRLAQPEEAAGPPAAQPNLTDGTGAAPMPPPLPGLVAEAAATFTWIDTVTREHYLRRWLTVSTVMTAGPSQRERMMTEIEAILDADPQTAGREEVAVGMRTEVLRYRRPAQ